MRRRQDASAKVGRHCGRRRGFSALIVLLLIAVTLGLSYASIRSQSVNVRIQRNASFRVSARSAAISGLTMALKAMHTDAWKGVDTTLTGRLSPHENFEVRFTTGDPLLWPGHADFDRYPYRVTLDAVGYAADPIHPTSIATHRAQVVVELIPRALSAPPAGLDDLLDHTLSQWDSGKCELCVPFHVEGPVRFRDRLNLSQALKWSSDPWWWYHSGLNEMRNAGRPDRRPLSGLVRFPFSRQDDNVHNLLRFALQVKTEDAPSTALFAWQSTDAVTSYQLYAGGKVYEVAGVSANIENIQLGPDPLTNPAGWFARSGTVHLRDGGAIRGSLFTRGSSSDIEVRGQGVVLEAFDLPALDGTSEPVHLPVLVGAGNIRFHRDSDATLSGLVLARDTFDVRAAEQRRLALRIEGHAAGRNLSIGPRSDWDRTETWWSTMWLLFWLQRSDGIAWFPEWLRLAAGFDLEPRLAFVQGTRPIRYHYYNPNQPIYVSHPDDEGLRWNVVRWTMNPDRG